MLRGETRQGKEIGSVWFGVGAAVTERGGRQDLVSCLRRGLGEVRD